MPGGPANGDRQQLKRPRAHHGHEQRPHDVPQGVPRLALRQRGNPAAALEHGQRLAWIHELTYLVPANFALLSLIRTLAEES